MAWRCLWRGLPAVLVVVLAVCLAFKTAFGVAAFTLFIVLPKDIFGPGAAISVVEVLAGLRAPGMLATLPADEAGWLCRAASLFKEHFKSYTILTADNQNAFEAACRRAMPSLEEEARRELQQLLRYGLLGHTLREQPQTPPDAHTEPWSTCSAAWSRKAETEMEGMELELLRRKGLRPLKERVVEASEVREALKHAENVRFDARGLLPARMFNTSIQELHALHEDLDIVVHATSDGKRGFEAEACWITLGVLSSALARGGPGSLLEWLVTRGMTDGVLWMLCNEQMTLRDLAPRMPYFQRPSWEVWEGRREREASGASYVELSKHGWGIMGSNVNTQRLPNWTRGAADSQFLAEKLGLGQQVDHSHSLLWFGASAGGIHTDVQDNILVQISGESDVVMIPANCSFALDIGVGLDTMHGDWLIEQGKGEDLPFFLIRLRAGEGLAIPSNSLHTVLSRDPKRIGMNFFFEPRYGQMRWPWSPSNFYNFAERGNLAMRALWVKTLKELWRSRKPDAPAFVIHGQRQEFI